MLVLALVALAVALLAAFIALDALFDVACLKADIQALAERLDRTQLDIGNCTDTLFDLEHELRQSRRAARILADFPPPVAGGAGEGLN